MWADYYYHYYTTSADDILTPMSTIVLAQQKLPILTKYSGEDPKVEPFNDWISQFEMIVGLCL